MDNTTRELKRIADELHQMNKVLDRMCQAFIFAKKDPIGFTIASTGDYPVPSLKDNSDNLQE